RHVVQIAVPDVLAALRQLDALELTAALIVEQAQLDLLGVGGEQREVGAAAIPACAETRKRSGAEAHALAFGYKEYGAQRRDREVELRRGVIPGANATEIADIGAAVQ